jgi:hypothetical protein
LNEVESMNRIGITMVMPPSSSTVKTITARGRARQPRQRARLPDVMAAASVLIACAPPRAGGA